MPAWEHSTTFEDFLKHKRISARLWQLQLPEEFAREAALFACIGPRSYDQQKKFRLNDWRLSYTLERTEG